MQSVYDRLFSKINLNRQFSIRYASYNQANIVSVIFFCVIRLTYDVFQFTQSTIGKVLFSSDIYQTSGVGVIVVKRNGMFRKSYNSD